MDNEALLRKNAAWEDGTKMGNGRKPREVTNLNS